MSSSLDWINFLLFRIHVKPKELTKFATSLSQFEKVFSLAHWGQPRPHKWLNGVCSKSPWIGHVIITLVLPFT